MSLGAIGGFAGGLGIGIGYGILSEYARYGITWAKWKAMKESGRNKIAEVLQALLTAEKDDVTGLSTKGQVDTIVDFIDKTLDFAGIVDESIATQMFVQMIQQSIAYAIHSSHAGSIGTVGNVYSGSMYLGSAEATSIGQYYDYVDRYSRGFLSAEVGQNLPTLAFSLLRGGDRRIEELYRSLLRDMDTLISEWNDLALMYYRHFHTMARSRFERSIEMKENLTERAYSLLEQVGNEHLARISEQLDTLEGARAWFDAGLMSSDELKDIAIRLNIERGASEGNYDDYKADIITAIGDGTKEWDAKITQALNDLKENETRYMYLIRSIFDVLFTDMTEFVDTLSDELQTTLEDVSAYRNVSKTTHISPSEEVTPYPQFELDIRVFQIEPM